MLNDRVGLGNVDVVRDLNFFHMWHMNDSLMWNWNWDLLDDSQSLLLMMMVMMMLGFMVGDFLVLIAVATSEIMTSAEVMTTELVQASLVLLLARLSFDGLLLFFSLFLR